MNPWLIALIAATGVCLLIVLVVIMPAINAGSDADDRAEAIMAAMHNQPGEEK